jgi:hypothetical protein
MGLACVVDLVDGPIRCLRALQRSPDVIVNAININESGRIENDMAHWDRPVSFSDPFAGKSLATPTLHVLGVKKYTGFTSLEPVDARLKFSFQEIKISLIGPESLDAFLGRHIDARFLDLMAQELVKRLDLTAGVRRHRSMPPIHVTSSAGTRF